MSEQQTVEETVDKLNTGQMIALLSGVKSYYRRNQELTTKVEQYIDQVIARLRALAAPREDAGAGERQEYVNRLWKALEQCVEAMRLTREYVGEEMLPALEGWSWYDATVHAQDVLESVEPPALASQPDDIPPLT